MLIFLFYLYLVTLSIQIIYFLGIFRVFAFHKESFLSKAANKEIPISVIICAKNEAENLKKNLHSTLNQDYQNFEIILVNDSSSDNSLAIMQKYAKEYSFIKIVNVKNNEAFWGNKKYALTLGIKAAKHPYLLFTDADCIINSNQWIREMANKFTSKKTIVIGFSPYKKIKNSFLNALIRFETLLTALQYFSYAQIGIPYMGVGRNLAYFKKEFFNAKGFIKHMDIKSGDDDLLIKEIASKKNVAINYSIESITISEPKTSFTEWFRQKRRHVSTSSYYKTYHKLLLGIFFISQFLFWFLLIFLLCFQFNWVSVLSLAFLRMLIQFVIYSKSFKKLHDHSLSYFIPFLEVFLILFQFAIFITNSFSKPSYWK